MFRTLWFWSFARVPLNFTDCEWSLNYQIPEIVHVFTVYCVWPNCNYFMAEPASGQDEANPVFLLATRAGSIGRTCTLGISRVGPARKSFLSGLFSVLIDLNSVSVHKNAAKNFANIQPPWPHTWSITYLYDFLYAFLSTHHFIPSAHAQESAVVSALAQ